jgi:chemotaxis signal transduction protein
MINDEAFSALTGDDCYSVQHIKLADDQVTAHRLSPKAARAPQSETEFSTIACLVDGHSFAINCTAVDAITNVKCASAPPWAKPWIAGLSWVNNNLFVVIDPLGLMRVQTSYQPVSTTIIVMRTHAYQPHWAMAVDSVQAQPNHWHGVQQRACLPVGWHCPDDWFHEVIDSQGTSVTVLDHEAITGAIAHRYCGPDAA